MAASAIQGTVLAEQRVARSPLVRELHAFQGALLGRVAPTAVLGAKELPVVGALVAGLAPVRVLAELELCLGMTLGA